MQNTKWFIRSAYKHNFTMISHDCGNTAQNVPKKSGDTTPNLYNVEKDNLNQIFNRIIAETALRFLPSMIRQNLVYYHFRIDFWRVHNVNDQFLWYKLIVVAKTRISVWIAPFVIGKMLWSQTPQLNEINFWFRCEKF